MWVQEPTMGAEDFALHVAPSHAYCFIANGQGEHRVLGHGGGPCTLHNPSYDFNDDLIPWAQPTGALGPALAGEPPMIDAIDAFSDSYARRAKVFDAAPRGFDC